MPAELWQGYQQGMALSGPVSDALLVPDYYDEKRVPRYYQRIDIERAGGACLAVRPTGRPCVEHVPSYHPT